MTSPNFAVNPRLSDDRARSRSNTSGSGLHRTPAATVRPPDSGLSTSGALLLLIVAFLAIVAFASFTRGGGLIESLRQNRDPAELSRDAKYRAPPHRDSPELRRELIS